MNNNNQPCAAGPCCCLGGTAPGTHKCPGCCHYIHVLCGVEVAVAAGGNHMNNIMCRDCKQPTAATTTTMSEARKRPPPPAAAPPTAQKRARPGCRRYIASTFYVELKLLSLAAGNRALIASSRRQQQQQRRQHRNFHPHSTETRTDE